MKEIRHKNKKRFLKNLAYGVGGLILLGGTYITISNNGGTYLKSEDFSKAEWMEFDNANGRIWSCYTNENIPKNQFNWHFYTDEVRKRNNNNLEGRILLPDLDSDGKVGK